MAGIDGMILGVVGLALASVLVLLWRRRKTDAELLFAMFCGSLAMALLQPRLGDAPGLVQVLVTLGACATCNAYWLVSRALFRGDGGVRPVHLAAAGGIAALILLYRAAEAAGADGGMGVLGDLLTLASSTVLMLAFVEALRGWRTANVAERRLRAAFVAVYGGCLLVGTALSGLASADSAWAEAHRVAVLGCATAIIVFTHVALVLRRRWSQSDTEFDVPIDAAADVIDVARDSAPAHRASNAPTLRAVAPSAEDVTLGQRLQRLLVQRALYRETELKVADLAKAAGSAEHRVSRAITQGLGERNFNQWVNRHRIEHACRLLEADDGRTVLDICFDSGFASLGPFNRAFKAAMGCTPTAWRAARQNAALPPTDTPACPSS